MLLLPSILKNESHRHPLLVLQSSLAQSSLPILTSILAQELSVKGSTRHKLLFCLLYQPSSLTEATTSTEVHDWTDRIPGYGQSGYSDELLAIVENGVLRNQRGLHFRSRTLPSPRGAVSRDDSHH